LYYLSGTPLGDIHIHAITTYHIMYLISVKIDYTLTVNKKIFSCAVFNAAEASGNDKNER
jgi:hypothetical protein